MVVFLMPHLAITNRAPVQLCLRWIMSTAAQWRLFSQEGRELTSLGAREFMDPRGAIFLPNQHVINNEIKLWLCKMVISMKGLIGSDP